MERRGPGQTRLGPYGGDGSGVDEEGAAGERRAAGGRGVPGRSGRASGRVGARGRGCRPAPTSPARLPSGAPDVSLETSDPSLREGGTRAPLRLEPRGPLPRPGWLAVDEGPFRPRRPHRLPRPPDPAAGLPSLSGEVGSFSPPALLRIGRHIPTREAHRSPLLRPTSPRSLGATRPRRRPRARLSLLLYLPPIIPPRGPGSRSGPDRMEKFASDGGRGGARAPEWSAHQRFGGRRPLPRYKGHGAGRSGVAPSLSGPAGARFRLVGRLGALGASRRPGGLTSLDVADTARLRLDV